MISAGICENRFISNGRTTNDRVAQSITAEGVGVGVELGELPELTSARGRRCKQGKCNRPDRYKQISYSCLLIPTLCRARRKYIF